MKKFFAVTLGLLTLFASTACGAQQAPQENVAPKNEKIFSINTFDSHADLNSLTLNGVLGKVEVNQEDAYLKSGDGSAKVTVISDPYKAAQPYLYQAMNVQKTGVDCTDFSKVEHVTMDVYNPQSKVKRIGMQPVFTDAYNKGVIEWFDLKASGWTKVKYTIAREYIPLNKNEQGEKVHLVTGMNIIFDRPSENEEFYLDDMKIYKTDKGFTPVKMALGKDEICSFDKLWQVQKLGLECYDGAELVPTVSYVKDITSTGSGAALRMDTIPGPGAGRWPGIVLNEEMLSLVDWASYGDNDRFCFDVYTPTTNSLDKIYPNLYVNGVRFVSADGISLKRGEWITVSYTVKELNAYGAGKQMDFSQVTGIKIFYLEHSGTSKVVYLDNFRMERA